MRFSHSVTPWEHAHVFGLDQQLGKERKTQAVVVITLITMIVELVTGYMTGSMALTADGWHMGTHAAALGMAAFTYAFARRHVHNRAFTFGTGKVGPLGGFASAVILAVTALLIAWESATRLLHPVAVQFDEATLVAVVGLVINLICAFILGHDHDHGAGEEAHHDDHHDDHHDHGHDHHDHDHHEHHDHPAEHTDHNLKAAFLHVMADALTSLTAIFALLAGKYLGWVWMDPVMGIAGSLVIAIWAKGLIRETSRILLDAEVTDDREKKMRALLEEDGLDRVSDLHFWRVGPASYACIVSLVTHHPKCLDDYRKMLGAIPGLEHVTVEVNLCDTCQVAG